MKKFISKTSFRSIALSSGLISFLVVFTNMTQSERAEVLVQIQPMINESLRLSQKLNSQTLSNELRSYVISHKKLVTKYIGLRIRAKNCLELRQVDTSMISGEYLMSPEESLDRKELFRCTIANGQLTENVKIRDVDLMSLETGVDADNSNVFIYSSEVACNSANGANQTRCNVAELVELPQLITEKSSGCVINQSYGVDHLGVWVKNDCRATFLVRRHRSLADLQALSLEEETAFLNTMQVQDTSQMNGYLDSVTFVNNKVEVRGWVCGVGFARSLAIFIYQGPFKQGGINLGLALANSNHEAGVTSACRTGGVGHRFVSRLDVTPAMISGRPIHVYAVSPFRENTLYQVKYSGTKFMPALPGFVTGTLDQVAITDKGIVLHGWACQVGDPRPVAMIVYRQPVTTGAPTIAVGTANQNHEAAVSARCSSGATAHRYQIPIPQSAMLKYGDPVYIYGLSKIQGKPNAAMAGSGKTTPIPSLSWTAGAVKLYSRIDVQSKNANGVLETTNSCIHPMYGRTSMIFNGQCANGKIISPNTTNLVRICTASNSGMTWNLKCSAFVALSPVTSISIPGVATVVERRNSGDR